MFLKKTKKLVFFFKKLFTNISKYCKIENAIKIIAKNKFLGGEGLFNTVITGPGRIVVQTMPISAVANSLSRFFPQGN